MDMVVDIRSFSEDELKIIAALAFDDEFVSFPELSVATRLKPTVVKQAVDNLLNKKVLKESYTDYNKSYKLRKN